MMKPPKWMGCLLVLLVTCGCSPGGPGLAELASPTPATRLGVEIVNHSRPDLAVDLEPFRTAGCVPGDSGRWTCTESSPVAAFTCDQLREPSRLLGGLDGAVHLLQCEITPRRNAQGLDPATLEARIEEEGYFYRYGCTMPAFVRYVVWRGGGFELLSNTAELAQVYAPISSPDEALGYVLAITGDSAYYGLAEEEGYRYLTDRIEDTFAVEVREGTFEVHLFRYRLCGCGPHTTYAADYLVSEEGEVTLREVIPLYEDPAQDDLCVD